MTKKFMIVAAIAATFVSGAAFAQTYDNRDYRNDNRGETRYEQQDRAHRSDRNDYSQRSQHYDRRDQYDRRDHYDRHSRYDNSYRGYERRDYSHHGARYGVRRGEYLAHHYRGSRYVVSDWRGRRHLYAPPRGYQWVQAGNDYLLVALATGVIAQVLLNN